MTDESNTVNHMLFNSNCYKVLHSFHFTSRGKKIKYSCPPKAIRSYIWTVKQKNVIFSNKKKNYVPAGLFKRQIPHCILLYCQLINLLLAYSGLIKEIALPFHIIKLQKYKFPKIWDGGKKKS